MKSFTKKLTHIPLIYGAVALMALSFQSCTKNSEQTKPIPAPATNITDADGDFAGGLSSDTGTTISKGLLAYWPLAGNAYDFSGNRNDEVSYNVTPATDRGGNAGGAYNFNGTSSHIDISTTGTINIANTDFSLNAWVNIPAYKVKNTADILNAKPTEQTGWHFYITGSDGTAPGLVGFSHKASEKNYTSKTAIGLNSWHMVTVTYKLVNKTLKIHIDGILDKSITNVDGPDGALSRLFIGRQNPAAGDGNFFTGAMSDIRIYNRALTGAEIKYLRYVSTGPTNGLIGYWPLTKTANDFSPARHDNGYPYSSNGFPFGVKANTDRFDNPLGAYRFGYNGKGGSVDIPQPVSLSNADFTYNTWLKIAKGTTGMKTIFMQYKNGFSGAFELDVTGGGNLTFYADALNYITGTQTVSSDTWHMVTCVYAAADGAVKFYVDGAPDTGSYNLNIGAITETDDLVIGFGSIKSFNGSINDFREYNRALSNSEIQQLYHTLN